MNLFIRQIRITKRLSAEFVWYGPCEIIHGPCEIQLSYNKITETVICRIGPTRPVWDATRSVWDSIHPDLFSVLDNIQKWISLYSIMGFKYMIYHWKVGMSTFQIYILFCTKILRIFTENQNTESGTFSFSE